MKKLSSPFAKLVAITACALTLGSCNRAEYAMLPQGSSYHGVTRVATPVPAATTTVEATPVSAAETVAAPQAPATVAVTGEAPAATPAKTAAPAASIRTASTTAATTAPKASVMQRLALNKVTRKVDKLMQKSTAQRHDNTASTSKTAAISGNLRTGLILLLVGLLVGIFNGLIGTIIALIGVIFIVLWLLDSL